MLRKSLFALILLAVGLISFELFNFTTSKIALDGLFGSFNLVTFFGRTFTLGGLLAGGAATIDIGGILRIFTPEKGKHEPAWVGTAYTFWLLASAINAGLTYWFVRLALMEFPRMPPEMVGREPWVALGMAIFVWAIRFGIVTNFAATGDEYFHISPSGGGPAGTSFLSKLRPKKTSALGRKPKTYTTPPASTFPPLNRRFLTSPPQSSEGQKRGPKNRWNKSRFLKESKQNSSLKSLSPEEVAKMTGTSERNARRWLEAANKG